VTRSGSVLSGEKLRDLAHCLCKGLARGRKCFAQPIIEETIINAREQLFAFIHAKKFQNAGGPG
jgi:hypothetical protein